jgi:chromosome segregation ATPase
MMPADPVERLERDLAALTARRAQLERELATADEKRRQASDARASSAAAGSPISRRTHQEISELTSDVRALRDGLALLEADITAAEAAIAQERHEASLRRARAEVDRLVSHARAVHEQLRSTVETFLVDNFLSRLRELRLAHDDGRKAVSLLTALETDDGRRPQDATVGRWSMDLYDDGAEAVSMVSIEGYARAFEQRRQSGTPGAA